MEHHQIDAHFWSDIGYEINTRRRYSPVSACQLIIGRKYLYWNAKGIQIQIQSIEITKEFVWIEAESKVIMEVSHGEYGEMQVKPFGVWSMSNHWGEGYLNCLRQWPIILGKW